MENNKGICSICINDKHCALPRRFPVWQCEEYADRQPQMKRAQKKRQRLNQKVK
jgi:hypothetical protein